MAGISGGRLAAAVTAAGGLGLIGGGYGDAEWLPSQIRHKPAAHESATGSSPGAWPATPELLDLIVARQPATIMLSFGELAPFAERIRTAGIPLTARCRTSSTHGGLWTPARMSSSRRAARRAGTA